MTDREKLAQILGIGLSAIGIVSIAAMAWLAICEKPIPVALSNTAIAAVAALAGATYIPGRTVVTNGPAHPKPPANPHDGLPPRG